MIYSVCVNNQDLISVGPICIDWETPFLNLYFDREKARQKHFADNGRNWQHSDTDYSFKTTLLDVYLDENDHITGLSMYKYQSTSFNHGKNSSKELKVTASDIKEKLSILQEIVSDPSEEELEKLLSDVRQSKYGIERQFKAGKTSVSIHDENGTVQLIKQKTLLKAIQISHKYLEILHNYKVFSCCPKDFPEEIRPVLHELLSFVNTGKYYRIDSLKQEMERRELIEEAEESYPRLRQAVIDGDLAEVNRLAKFAKVLPSPCQDGSPLYHAVKDNKNDIAKVLLENGAYVLEIERDGSHYPLEIAYNNRNRELVHLLISYHGAKSKTYSVFKHNMDNVIRSCAENKDYEVLRLIIPEAFTFDMRTWLTPDMFPEMNEETIQEISTIEGLRVAWSLDIIQPIYEKKNFELCRRMLCQGSTKEVVEYFIAENDFEMFEVSVSCHADLGQYGKYTPVFERGGKWYDVLSKHVLNLHQREYAFFEGLLNNGNIDRYMEIIQNRGCAFIGIGGYMVFPEKVTEPEKYINLVQAFIEKGQPAKSRLLFLEDIIRYFGDEKLARQYYTLCPLSADTNWRSFRDNKLIPDYIRRANNPYAGAELVRSFFAQDIEEKEKKASELVLDLIHESYRRFPGNMIEDEADLDDKSIRCLLILRAVLDNVSIQDINLCIKERFGSQGIENAFQFAEGKNILSLPFLLALKA